MSNLKDKLSNIVAVLATIVAIAQAAVMAYNTWLATATAAPTVAEYIQLAILIAIGVIGALQGRNADGSTKTTAQLSARAANK